MTGYMTAFAKTVVRYDLPL